MEPKKPIFKKGDHLKKKIEGKNDLSLLYINNNHSVVRSIDNGSLKHMNMCSISE